MPQNTSVSSSLPSRGSSATRSRPYSSCSTSPSTSLSSSRSSWISPTEVVFLRIHMLSSLIYLIEIDKAEETVMRVDRARLRAEEQAARERSKVRQLMEKIAIDDALHQGRELGFREGLERGKMLGWAELMTRRHDLDDRESGRQSRQSISRPASASSNPARRGSTPRWAVYH